MGRIDGKVAVITGAASGIGRASAVRFAREGAHVVVVDINEAGANEVVKEIADDGGSAMAMAMDVGVEAEIRRMIAETVSKFGRIDVLFNNALNTAAAKLPSESDFLTFDAGVFESIVRVNVLAGVLASKYAIPHMIDQGGGSILFTSSVSAFGGDVSQYSYGASKAMVNWYVKTIATSFGKKGVRCNAIVPGIIQTPAVKGWVNAEMEAAFMQLLNSPRMGEPEDIAALALFLVSDEAFYLNGGFYFAEGGMSASLPFVQLQRDFALPKGSSAKS